MKYTEQERLDIGCRVYNNEFTKREAMERYGITETKSRVVLSQSNGKYEEFNSMSREELIGEIIKARINELRAKKGYTVRGDGTEKVFEPIVSKNTK